jgi:hypothetical protein
MVKIQDGQLIVGSKALSGEAEDDDGKPLKFEAVQGALVPTWAAKANMNDGSGRVRFYSFGLEDTNVRVSVITKTAEEIKAEEQAAVAAKKEADESAAKSRKEALEATQKREEQQQPKQQKQQEQPKTEKAFKTTAVPQNKNKK